MQQRITSLVMEFATNPLKRNAPFVLRAFRFVVDTKLRLAMTRIPSGALIFGEATKEFQRFCSYQLQRLALRASDYLLVK